MCWGDLSVKMCISSHRGGIGRLVATRLSAKDTAEGDLNTTELRNKIEKGRRVLSWSRAAPRSWVAKFKPIMLFP